MDLRPLRVQDARYVDNESNDSGLSSETSQNSKERPTNIFDSRNLSSIRAVHFALDNHRKMASQRSQSAVNNDRKPLQYSTVSMKDSKDVMNFRSKPNPQMSPFMVKINPKSSPCCEYLMDDIKQLKLPISDNIEIGCNYSPYHQDLGAKSQMGVSDTSSQYDEQDSAPDSPCYEEKFSHHPNFQEILSKENYCSQSDFRTFTISKNDESNGGNSEHCFHSFYQSENCIHLIIQSLDQSKDLISSFRLLMSSRDPGFKLKSTNQIENAFSGIIVLDVLRAENLQPSSAPQSAPSLRLLQCTVKMDSECRIETSTEIFGDKVIWDERFIVDLRETEFISFLIYQSTEDCNKRLSYYGGISLTELINDLQNQSQLFDQIILQLEPRGLLYIQLGLVSLHHSLKRHSCGSLSKNMSQNALHNSRYSNLVLSLSDWIYILRWCIAAADEKHRQTTNNLYKITASETKILHLLKQIMSNRQHGNQFQININVHSLTSLIILCLREMSEPLIPYEFYERFLVINESFFNVYDPNGQHLAAEILAVLKTLPNQNQMATFELIQHLHGVIQNGATNKVTCHYIALLFGPLIFQNEDSFKYQNGFFNIQIHLMKCLLDNWSFIQDSKSSKIQKTFKTDKYFSKSVVSVAIQTEEINSYTLPNLISESLNLEEHNCKTLSYKSILKKPQSASKQKDTSSNKNCNRTTFI